MSESEFLIEGTKAIAHVRTLRYCYVANDPLVSQQYEEQYQRALRDLQAWIDRADASSNGNDGLQAVLLAAQYWVNPPPS